jgi:FMS-like tyrosine kinase 1
VKIADFGMARFLNQDDYYRQRSNKPVPVKWMAPESVLQKIYTEKSDVWSFGVTSWEIFSLGKSPYMDVTNDGIIDYLYSGNRLTRPTRCPPGLFEIISRCWMKLADERKNFKTLLDDLTEYVKQSVPSV